jgi:hypothetical protein
MKSEEQVPMARGTVAPGRTVCIPHPTEKVNVGPHPVTLEPMLVPKLAEHGPGAEITLPAEDIAQLLDMGFLVRR